MARRSPYLFMALYIKKVPWEKNFFGSIKDGRLVERWCTERGDRAEASTTSSLRGTGVRCEV
jgi:hypothetical protein